MGVQTLLPDAHSESRRCFLVSTAPSTHHCRWARPGTRRKRVQSSSLALKRRAAPTNIALHSAHRMVLAFLNVPPAFRVTCSYSKDSSRLKSNMFAHDTQGSTHSQTSALLSK